MVSPEGTGTLPDRPKSGRGILLAIAALVIAAGFAVLGALSPAEQMAVETTTTTTATTASSTTTTVIDAPIDLANFDVGQIVTGEPLELIGANEIGDGYPVALVEHESTYYVFTVDPPQLQTVAGGISAWSSQDGLKWRALGEVIGPDLAVSNIMSVGDELVALGSSLEDASMWILRSDDGSNWIRSLIDIEAPTPPMRTYGTSMAWNEGITVVATMTSPDVERIVTEAVDGADLEVEISRWGWGMGSDSQGQPTFTIHGPLGIQLAEIPLEDLDLTEEERELVVQGYQGNPESAIWASTNGSGWQRSTVEGVDWVQAIFSSDSRGFVLLGSGSTGPRVLASDDGLTWEAIDASGGVPWNVHQWGERLVGARDTSLPDLMTSEDGETWESAGLAERFPTAIQWSTYPTAAGPGGVALVVSSFATDRQVDDPEAVTLVTDKGHTVSLDPMSGRMEVETGEMSHTWHIYGGSQADDLLPDLDQETIELLDPESGVSFGTVTFDEVQQAEEDFYRTEYREDVHRALVFTPDGEQWTIQDLAASLGPEASITNLMVGSDRLVAVVAPERDWYYPMPHSGFEIWTAPLP